MRIRRSYIINLNPVNEVADSYVLIENKNTPIGAGTKKQLLQQIQVL